MKIENKLVSIRVGDKQYDLKNLITNEYLTRFAKTQNDVQNYSLITNDKSLRYCLLKFDSKINLNDNIELHNQDFDVCFVGGVNNIEQNISQKSINIKYTYFTNFNVYDYKKSTASNVYISDYYGKKITAIGFNSHWLNDANMQYKIPVLAVIDTSNYNIYLQKNQDIKIVRQDVVSTDAEFYCSNSKVTGPIHLAPDGGNKIIEQEPFLTDYGNYLTYDSRQLRSYGSLYSIGLSSYKNSINKELIIGQDIFINQNGNEIKFPGIENYISNKLLHPSIIYPSSALYPLQSNYKYMFFKYKVYQVMGEWTGSNGSYNMSTYLQDLNIYYYQRAEIDKFGLSDFIIKYERRVDICLFLKTEL